MRILTACLLIAVLALPATAWNGAGHMTVAYIAYQKLAPQTKARVDILLRANPNYQTWIQGVPAAQRDLVAFLKASNWPDDIKSDTAYAQVDGTDGGNTPPLDNTANQNTGYQDHARHKYWHFVDLPHPTLGQRGTNPAAVNAATEIVLLRDALRNTDTAAGVENMKSYDIAWLIHLVGDIHQPLHATTRFTRLHPRGDTGGNDVKFSNQQGDNLHSFWDGLLGSDQSLTAIQTIGNSLLMNPTPAGATVTDTMRWASDSLALAKTHAYRTPISDGSNAQQPLSPRPNAAYEMNAKTIARQQALLAGYRLANLLNTSLK